MALGDNAKAAAKAVGLDVQIVKVTDPALIAGFGIMSTPGLVVDDKVLLSGRVRSVELIGALL